MISSIAPHHKPSRRSGVAVSRRTVAGCIALVALVDVPYQVDAFHSLPSFRQRRRLLSAPLKPLYSSVGGNVPPTPPGGGGGRKGNLDDFLDPSFSESDNLARAREFISEKSLPISFGNNPDVTTSPGAADSSSKNGESESLPSSSSSSALVGPPSSGLLDGDATSADLLAKNPYLAVVSQITPSDLISKFSATAHPRVQNAVRTTILGLIGGLPKMAFDTKIITTGQRLASLMFQLQMTGYMFKNAEYRLSLSQSLGMATSVVPSSNLLLTGSDDDEDDEGTDPLTGKVRGKLKIRYGLSPTDDAENSGDNNSDGAASSGGLELEVDAASYLSELRSEVSQLRDELTRKRQAKEEALRKDLLLYIRTLPEQQLRSLTNTISQDVLVAMKGLVNVVVAGITDGKQQIGADTVTEQSGEAMAQLCIWQLVVGYNLRELEVREEIRNSLMSNNNNNNNYPASSSSATPPDEVGGVDFSQPGTLE